MARISAQQRMEARLDQMLTGRTRLSVAVRAELRGRAAELWLRAWPAGHGLGEGDAALEPAELIGLLLDHGLTVLEAACKRRRSRKAEGTNGNGQEHQGLAD